MSLTKEDNLTCFPFHFLGEFNNRLLLGCTDDFIRLLHVSHRAKFWLDLEMDCSSDRDFFSLELVACEDEPVASLRRDIVHLREVFSAAPDDSSPEPE